MSVMILLIPIGLIVVLVKHPAYASLRMPAYGLILAILGLGGSMLFFILRGRMLKSIYILAALNMVFISVIPFASKEIEGYASSKNACEYLLNNYKVDNTILCAKFFVRGVKYYTDKEVAVMDIPGKQFFSPHPVPFLDSDDKVRAFLSKQSVTYCIIKKSGVEDLDRLCKGKFKFVVLKIIGNEYIVKVEQTAA